MKKALGWTIRWDFGRRGMFLPLVLILLVLTMASILALTRYGAGTRHLFAHYEKSLRCRDAAMSALLEVRRKLEADLAVPAARWDSFWRNLLPPFTSTMPAPLSIRAEAAGLSYLPELRVAEVLVRCLDRRVERGRAQGLLCLSVEVAEARNKGGGVEIFRQEWVRYVIFRHPSKGIRILLVPGSVCAEVKGS